MVRVAPIDTKMQPEPVVQFSELRKEKQSEMDSEAQGHSLSLALLNICVGLAAFFSVTIVPYETSFVDQHIPNGLPPSVGWQVFDAVIEIIFVLDMIRLLFCAVKQNASFAGITNAVFDMILSSIALVGTVVKLTGDGPPPMWSTLCRLSRVFLLFFCSKRVHRGKRVHKMSSLKSGICCWRHCMMGRWFFSSRGVRIANLFCGLTLVSHLLACGWYLCAALHENHADTWVSKTWNENFLEASPAEQWFIALHAIFTALAGGGGLGPSTLRETVFDFPVQIVGAVVVALVFSEVICVVMSVDEVAKRLQDQSQIAEKFCDHCHVDEGSRAALVDWAGRALTEQPGAKHDMQQLLLSGSVPHNILQNIALSVVGGLFRTSSFLQCLSQPVHHELVVQLAVGSKEAFFLQREIVYRSGGRARSMYLVQTGTFANVARPSARGGLIRPGTVVDDASPYQVFSFRSYFGDLDLHGDGPLTTTAITCSERGQALIIDKTSLFEIERDFPMEAHQWNMQTRRRRWHHLSLLRRLRRTQCFRHFAATQIQAFVRTPPPRSCFRRANLIK